MSWSVLQLTDKEGIQTSDERWQRKNKPDVFISDISLRKILGIDNSKLKSQRKPLGKADCTFLNA